MSADDHERPHLRLAVANGQKDVDRDRAKQGISWPLRKLAANIIRVARGAGRPWEVGQQCQHVVESFEAYKEVCGVWPSSEEVQETLSARSKITDRLKDEPRKWALA